MHRIKKLLQVMLAALKLLLANEPLRMAGATAFFTTFALPAMLIVIVQVFAVIVGPRTIRGLLGDRLSDTFGPEAMHQVVDAIKAIRALNSSWYISIAGFLFLLFVVTTLFTVFKGSINQLWRVRPAGTQKLFYSLIGRLRSIALLLLAGLMVIVGTAAELLQALLSRQIIHVSVTAGWWFNAIINYTLSIAIVACWLVGVFRYLADGRPAWRVAWAGALLTSTLFSIGRVVLHLLLTFSHVTTIYGASASIIVLMLFVFYTSLILYYGAAFTRVYGNHTGRPIQPAPHAAYYKVKQVD